MLSSVYAEFSTNYCPILHADTVNSKTHILSGSVMLTSANKLTNKITYSRVIPEKIINTSSANQEILHIIWNPIVHYGVHNRPSLVPTLSQMNTFHTLSLYYLKTLFNIIMPYRLS